jgi:hypothetical protein
MEFSEVEGKEFPFYGIDGYSFKLGDMVFEALEDPCDGYRSYLGSIEVVERTGIFFPNPIATVKIVPYDSEYKYDSTRSNIGHKLVDVEDGHVWLEVGTDAYDDWYPCFAFRYQPKSPAG